MVVYGKYKCGVTPIDFIPRLDVTAAVTTKFINVEDV